MKRTSAELHVAARGVQARVHPTGEAPRKGLRADELGRGDGVEKGHRDGRSSETVSVRVPHTGSPHPGVSAVPSRSRVEEPTRRDHTEMWRGSGALADEHLRAAVVPTLRANVVRLDHRAALAAGDELHDGLRKVRTAVTASCSADAALGDCHGDTWIGARTAAIWRLEQGEPRRNRLRTPRGRAECYVPPLPSQSRPGPNFRGCERTGKPTQQGFRTVQGDGRGPATGTSHLRSTAGYGQPAGVAGAGNRRGELGQPVTAPRSSLALASASATLAGSLPLP